MSAAAKLRLIEESLDEIETWREKHDSAGNARDAIDELPSLLHSWNSRAEFFDSISSDLSDASQTGESEEVVRSLMSKAEKSEAMLNVALPDPAIPAKVADVSIRYIVDDAELIASPSIQEGLINCAIFHPDPDVRRLAWLSICRCHGQNPPGMNGGGFHRKYKRAKLKELRQTFMAKRAVLGPRGSILKAAEIRPEAGDLSTELLEVLANPEGVDRREVALTLGEIGGPEDALMLADALRAELEENGADQPYQAYLATALGKLGGPHAVDALLRAAKNGFETVRLAALSALESLATGGYVALTEYPESVALESAEMREAYLYLADQLSEVISLAEDLPYVRRKAEDLLDNVQTSLESASALA